MNIVYVFSELPTSCAVVDLIRMAKNTKLATKISLLGFFMSCMVCARSSQKEFQNKK